MNNFSEILPTDGSNFSNQSFYNDTLDRCGLLRNLVVNIVIILLGFPLNSYVVWLIVRGTGNGLAAEFFTLSLSICEMLLCEEPFFIILSCKFGMFQNVVNFLDRLTFTARPLFQCLICVERYLAVVHPVIFLKYKPLRYKVICCVGVWAVSVMFGGLNIMFRSSSFMYLNVILILAQFTFFLSIQLFCLVAVLRALKQSGPGERKREKEENLMKKKAFNTILITTVTVVVSFCSYLILVLLLFLGSNANISYGVVLLIFVKAGWPQSIQFLYRVGKLHFITCK